MVSRDICTDSSNDTKRVDNGATCEFDVSMHVNVMCVCLLYKYLCQAETQRLKKEAHEKGKELAEKQAPLLSLRSQRTTLEIEKREKEGIYILYFQVRYLCLHVP